MPLLRPSRTQLTLLPKGDMAASYSLIRRVSGHLKGERSHHARGAVFLPSLKRRCKAGPSPSPCHCTPTSWRGQPKVGTSLFSLADARLLAQGLPGTHQTSWPPSGGLNWEENVGIGLWCSERNPGFTLTTAPLTAVGFSQSSCQRKAFLPSCVMSSALAPMSVCAGHPPLNGPRRRKAAVQGVVPQSRHPVTAS